MMKKPLLSRGFTIVELLIVIVVIGILAAISIVAYNGIQNRAEASKEIRDLQSISQAINLYYVDNGQYPSTGGSGSWVGWSQLANFVPGITPKYMANQPQQSYSANAQRTYLYTSDGVNYKLISHLWPSNPDPICSAAISAVPQMTDGSRNCWGFGIWSLGAAGW